MECIIKREKGKREAGCVCEHDIYVYMCVNMIFIMSHVSPSWDKVSVPVGMGLLMSPMVLSCIRGICIQLRSHDSWRSYRPLQKRERVSLSACRVLVGTMQAKTLRKDIYTDPSE